MQKKKSTLGFLMEYLDIPTVSLARELHVDSSLVSKWKSGSRLLSPKSEYFDSVILYLLKISSKTDHLLLTEVLHQLYPQEPITQTTNWELQLRRILQNGKAIPNTAPVPKELSGATKVSTLVFRQDSGRRQAIRHLLDYAQKMNTPGNIIFIDSEEYEWLIQNPTFAKHFTDQMESLLLQGFHAQFVIHYSSYRERFLRLFETCGLLIFHRNIKWFCYEYYDETVFQFSLFILNHALSMLGISEAESESTTLLFEDPALVIQHETMAHHMVQNCRQLFQNYPPNEIKQVVDEIYEMQQRGILYCFLPAPAFFAMKEELLIEVLKDNELEDSLIQTCLSINQQLRDITRMYFAKKERKKEAFVHVFQLEEMIRRAHTKPFVSCSLTLLGGRNVNVSSKQYARCIQDLVSGMERHENLEIVLVSNQDQLPLPSINCWCKQNAWMIQMDEEGFRLSDEISIVNAAATTLERCIRKVPPERKEKKSVKQFLLKLAEELLTEV